MRIISAILVLVALSLTITLIAHAQSEAESDTDLAKETQNPLADLISIPFQNNIDFNVGPNDRTRYILNIQPVIPFKLAENWNLITRTILPVIYQPNVLSNSGGNTGLGDLNFTAWLSPRKAGRFLWGIGGTLVIPTATEDTTGTDKWSAGPSVVGVFMQGAWVVGGLVSNFWSFAGNSDRQDVNFLFSQLFVNYNLNNGWYLTSAPIITSDWNADNGNKWTLPVGGGGGKVFHVGKLPVNLNLHAYYNVEKPELTGADWQLRCQLQFLFPR